MNTPSVTGRKPQVPNRDDAEMAALAFCKVSVSALTRHWKIDALALFCASAGGPKQPAAVAKA